MLKAIEKDIFYNYPLKQKTFIKIGGAADIFFEPTNYENLSYFLQKQKNYFCCGNFSNVIVKDEGIDCVLSLDKLCNEIKFFDKYVEVGAAVQMSHFIIECAKRNLSSCEDLYTIPGKIGGMIFMNAGIPKFEIKDNLISIKYVDKSGNIQNLNINKMNMQYRKSNLPNNIVILSATFTTKTKQKAEIIQYITEIKQKRLQTQPITSKTCGSTFKNPPNNSAWKLIKESGANNVSFGGISLSQMHCNFLINDGTGTSQNVIDVINKVKDIVLQKTNILLEEEVLIIGK